jgi:hypothetical protein
MRYRTVKVALAWAACLASLATPPVLAGTQSYTTEFDGTENPLSEGGVWSHRGTYWTVVAKSNGIAYGTQTGTGGYDDSYAVLSGYSPNQQASAVVHLDPAIDRSCTHEVELLLRWADTSSTARGYEVNLMFDGSYAQIVRWNGPSGDFTVLGGGHYSGLKDGDVFEASIVDSVIKITVNDVLLAQVTDSTYKDGNPGIGFFRRECGKNSDFGFKRFQVSGSDGAFEVRPNPPTNVSVK